MARLVLCRYRYRWQRPCAGTRPLQGRLVHARALSTAGRGSRWIGCQCTSRPNTPAKTDFLSPPNPVIGAASTRGNGSCLERDPMPQGPTHRAHAQRGAIHTRPRRAYTRLCVSPCMALTPVQAAHIHVCVCLCTRVQTHAFNHGTHSVVGCCLNRATMLSPDLACVGSCECV